MVKELDWLHLYGDLCATYVLGDHFLSVTTLRKSTYKSVCKLRWGCLNVKTWPVAAMAAQ